MIAEISHQGRIWKIALLEQSGNPFAGTGFGKTYRHRLVKDRIFVKKTEAIRHPICRLDFLSQQQAVTYRKNIWTQPFFKL